jgi:hypothetical protein
MSDTLRDVIKEEMSNILRKADEIDLGDRDRKDRMQPADDSEQGGRWYDNSKNESNVRDQLRQIVAEEYETLREEPQTSIEYRSGLRDLDASGSSRAWYMDENGDLNTKKIQEAAKKVTKKIIREMGEDTFRARAKNARSFDHLYEIFQDMRRFLPDSETVLREIAQAMGRESLEDAIKYIARMHDMPDIRQRVKSSRNTGDLLDILDYMVRVRGRTENVIDDLIQQMSNPELRNMIDHFDRLYIGQITEYPNI